MDRDRWWKNLRLAGLHLWKNGRETKGASVLGIVLSGLEIIEDNLSSSCPLNKSAINEIVSLGCRPRVGQYFAIEVNVLESRLLFEGVKMAEVIASSASESKTLASLTVHTDASVGVAAQGVDIVLIGANLISRTAAVSNKVGSLPAVLTAKYVAPGVKVVILSEKEKFLHFLPPCQKENNPQEVIQAWGELSSSLKESPHSQVNVKNVCFEWVSSDLIDHFITEDRDTDSKAIWEYAEEVGQKTDQYFANL